MELIEWPARITRALNISFHISRVSREAGANLFGVPQIVTPNIGVRTVTMDIPADFEEQRVKELEAHIAEMRGRYNMADLAICDPYAFGSQVIPEQAPFSDGTWFSDGTGFSDTSGGAQAVVTRNGNVAAGSNALWFDLDGPPRMKPFRRGDMFSYDGYLYTVVRRSNDGWVKFEPSARTAIPEGSTLQTDPARFYCRFATDDEGQRMRRYLKWGEPFTLRFVEAFDRP